MDKRNTDDDDLIETKVWNPEEFLKHAESLLNFEKSCTHPIKKSNDDGDDGAKKDPLDGPRVSSLLHLATDGLVDSSEWEDEANKTEGNIIKFQSKEKK